jgi:hypothetical protein
MKGNRIDSQLKAIEKDLKAGKKVTPMQALMDYGCMRLSGRIFELKAKGLKIKSEMKYAGEMRWAQYKLVK